MLLGRVLFDQGREDEALGALQRVGDGDRDWVDAQTLIGEIAIRQRHLAEAERIFRRVAEHKGRAVEPLRRLV
jgi:predicted negative regulator of RcsB-dependent stress response